MGGTLFEITERYQQLLDFAADGEIDEEIFENTLESIEGELTEKAENYGRVIRELEVIKGGLKGQVEAIEAEAARRKDHIKAIDNHIERMKSALCGAMVKTGKPKFKTENFSFWVQPTPPKTIIDGVVPMDYLVVAEPKPDLKAIKEAIEKNRKAIDALAEQMKELDEASDEAKAIQEQIDELKKETAFAHLESRDTVRFK